MFKSNEVPVFLNLCLCKEFLDLFMLPIQGYLMGQI